MHYLGRFAGVLDHVGHPVKDPLGILLLVVAVDLQDVIDDGFQDQAKAILDIQTPVGQLRETVVFSSEELCTQSVILSKTQ